MATKEKLKLSLSGSGNPVNHLNPLSASENAGVFISNAKAKSSKVSEEDWGNVDPDELFTKFTISEIKSIQVKLRAEADAKQEELRLMVGERYRDLLQASTSIVSMADTSREIVNAFAEVEDSITVLKTAVSQSKSPAIGEKEDGRLKAFQLLSAHVKLLLDAPEHLWRLIENKEYLLATWLYLLSRVVHRALFIDDPEEAIWKCEGIDVPMHFPVVQRQWDTITQLRPQIIHRATLYLRQTTTSSEACSVMLSLHLLDSLPLTEILATFLSQRWKMLNTLISKNLVIASTSRSISPLSRYLHKSHYQHESSKQTDVVSKIKEALLEVLEVIWSSLRTSRDVFGFSDEGSPSLIYRSLADIHSDTPQGSVLTTTSLLSKLPSSTHLLMLPAPILTYKPYIDLSSSTVQLESSALNSKLLEWFNKAVDSLEGRIRVWMRELHTIRELWGLRRRLTENLDECRGLLSSERSKIQGVIDIGIRERAVEVARKALHDIEDHLEEHLTRIQQDAMDNSKNTPTDMYPSTFTFSAPELPSPHPSLVTKSNGSPLKQFKYALRQRIDCRTPLLDNVLNDIETMAQKVGMDLLTMDKHPDSSGSLRGEILALYADATFESSRKIHQSLCKVIQEAAEKSIGKTALFVLIGRLAHYLSLSSWVESLRYPPHIAQELHQNLDKLHQQSLTHWRSRCVEVSLESYKPVLNLKSKVPNKDNFVLPSQPSYQLMNALFYMISSLDNLGLSHTEIISNKAVDAVLDDFRSAMGSRVSTKNLTWSREILQLLWDMVLLQRLSETRVAQENAFSIMLSRLQDELQTIAATENRPTLMTDIEHSIRRYLARSQSLLAPLLRPSLPVLENGHLEAAMPGKTKTKSSSLLLFGQPEAEHDYRPAMETAKPSARFGMLPVGSTSLQ